MAPIKIIMHGFGRTGKQIAKQVIKDKSLKLVAVIKKPSGKNIGKSVGNILKVKSDAQIWSSEDLQKAMDETKPDICIDFSDHNAISQNISVIAEKKINIIIGTTGFLEKELSNIKSYKDKIGILLAPNITEGINILMNLARTVSKIWTESDIEIIESHFSKKKDVPSGTALTIAKELRRKEKEVVIHSIRAGGIVGRHEVMFVTQNQKITIAHDSISRTAFADGAIKAAKWILRKKPDLYLMENVLGL